MSDITKIYSLGLSHVISKVISHAVKLRLDEKLTEKPILITTLAKQYNYHPTAMYRFLRLLDAYEIVKLTKTNYVKKGKMLNYLSTIRSPHITHSYAFINNIEECLKTNKESFSKTFGMPFYPYLLSIPELINDFRVWCTKSAIDWFSKIFKAYNFSKYKQIVDIGGGEGYFLATLLQSNKQQHGILFEQEAIITDSQKIFKQYGVSKRIQIITGDFFHKIPQNGDLYILCRVLLNWDDNDALRLINNCHSFLTPGTKLLIIDFVIPKKSNPSYKLSLINDINLLACVDSAIRTKQEWITLVKKSKFKYKHYYPVSNSRNSKLINPMFILELEA